jgi:hypothetical protein
MVNGKIVCAVTPPFPPIANHMQIYSCEYDPVANSFSLLVSAGFPAASG